MEILRCALALAVGATLGGGFGLLQNAALRRHQKREKEGNFKNAWVSMPGSAGRVVFLLIAFVLVQVICPMLFADSTKWWVSVGVVFGYGLILYRQIRDRRAGVAV